MCGGGVGGRGEWVGGVSGVREGVREEDEKVCAWSGVGNKAQKISRSERAGEWGPRTNSDTSHQPTLAFLSKLNAEHRAAPKKFLAGQSGAQLPSHAIDTRCPTVEFGVGWEEAIPLVLPCSWLLLLNPLLSTTYILRYFSTRQHNFSRRQS